MPPRRLSEPGREGDQSQGWRDHEPGLRAQTRQVPEARGLGENVKLDRTLPALWQLTGADLPALATVASRAHTVVLADVETLCASIVVEKERGAESYIPHESADLYEALGFLLGRTIEVLPRYDPTKGRRLHDPWTGGFKAWLYDELAYDLIDHWRSWNGRNGQKRMLPTGRSLIDHDGGVESASGSDVHDGRSQRERRSRGALAEDQSDSGDVGGDALRGLLEGGDRAVLREVAALGLGTAGRVGGRVARADRGVEDIELERVA